MNYPLPLRCGDTVGLIAPCSPITQQRLQQCKQTILSLGLNVSFGESVTQNLHGYLAGSDEVRANDMNQMFANDHIKAILCLRGGYGSSGILNLLDYTLIKHNPKIFVGYSDVTAIHLAFQKLCNFITFHGPMVSSNMVDNFDSYTATSFFEAIGMPKILPFQNPSDTPLHVIQGGFATGRLLGGCLSLISPSIGTFYQPNFKDAILFMEDINETVPRCDRLMYHLKNAGILNQISGVLLGDFVDCNNPTDLNYTIYDYFNDFFSNYHKPVIWGVKSGHATPMATLPFGTECTINTTNNTITFQYV